MKLLLVISFLVFLIVISRMDAKPVEGVPLNEEIVVMDQEKIFDPAGVIGNGNHRRRASANLNAVVDKDEMYSPPGIIGNGNRKRRASANLNAVVDQYEYWPPRPRVIANGDRKRRANATP